MKKHYLTILAVVLTAFSTASAKNLDAVTNLDAAIEQATKENKPLFIMMGREACGNCKQLHSDIAKGQVRVTKANFVIVDLNCDDQETNKAFNSRYKVGGGMLPFVVIAKPDGTMVASHKGAADPKAFNKFITDAKKDLK